MSEKEEKKTTETQSSMRKDKSKIKKGLKTEKVKKSRCSSCRRGEKSVDDIVNDFGDRLMKDEKVTIDDILKQHPKLAEKLKPLLEAEMALMTAGKEFRKETEKELDEFKDELWQKLEKKILEKQKKQIEAQLTKLKAHQLLAIKLRAEFIPMLLYVKGKTSRIGEGVRGITRFIKVLFLIDKETDLGKLTQPFYDFVPYNIGPFEPAIYQDLKVLEMAGVVKRETYTYKIPSNEQEIDEGFKLNNVSTRYTLTEKGMKYAQALINWADKKDPEIALTLRRYKTYYAQAPLKYLLQYIYEKYPEYTTESKVIKNILKGEKI